MDKRVVQTELPMRNLRDLSKKSITILAIALVLTQSISASVLAQQASIDSGLSYLQSTQSPDGSWAGTPTSLNTVLQSTATTARTLQLLGVSDTTLTDALGFLSIGQSGNRGRTKLNG